MCGGRVVEGWMKNGRSGWDNSGRGRLDVCAGSTRAPTTEG